MASSCDNTIFVFSKWEKIRWRWLICYWAEDWHCLHRECNSSIWEVATYSSGGGVSVELIKQTNNRRKGPNSNPPNDWDSTGIETRWLLEMKRSRSGTLGFGSRWETKTSRAATTTSTTILPGTTTIRKPWLKLMHPHHVSKTFPSWYCVVYVVDGGGEREGSHDNRFGHTSSVLITGRAALHLLSLLSRTD